MNTQKKQNRFYYFWSGAIVLALALVLFSLVFSSCAGAKKDPSASEQPGSAASQSETDPNSLSIRPKDPEAEQPAEEPAPDGPDSEEPPSGEEPAEPGEEPAPEEHGEEPEAAPAPAQQGQTILGETEDMGQEYIDKFVFLGDSTTYGLAVYNVVNKEQVWTPSSGTLTLDHWSYTAIYYPDTDEEIFITDAAQRKQPEYLLITLGINGVSFMSEDYFIQTYTDLVKAVQEASPDTKIILNSIYPIAASYANQGAINNDKINAANGWVLTVAQNTGVRYLDSASVLKGENGFMPESYQNGDGLHPTGETYGLVIDYIRTHGYQ